MSDMKHNSVPKMSIKVSICLKSIKSICIIGAQLKLHFPSRPTVKSSHSKGKSLSHVQLFATPWTVSYQAPRSMGFSRQEYWSGLPFPSPGDLPNPGIVPRSPALQTDALPSEPLFKTVLHLFCP